jgi:PAS domain S-box-containing protein
MGFLPFDWTKRVMLAAGAVVSVLSVAVLVAWRVHSIPLIQVLPTLTPMQRMTAVGLLLSSVALILATMGHRRAALICALLVLVEATLIGLEYVLNTSFGIDQLLGPDYINVHASHLGRMSPLTVLCFLGGGMALLVMSSQRLTHRGSAIGGILASMLIAVGTVNCLGYLLTHTDAYGWRQLARMGIHVSGSFVLLGVGLLAWAWQQSHVKKGAPEWLPFGIGLGLALGAVGVWQALMVHKESDMPRLSGIILAGGLVGSSLVAVAVALAIQARRHSRELQKGKDVLERTQEQLRSLTERLSLATRTASIGIWDWDLRRNVTVWDDTMFEIFGIPKVVPMPYKQFAQRIHPDDVTAVDASLERAIQGKTQDFVEFRITRPDGSVHHVSSAERAVLDERGNVVRVVGTAIDITGRKEMLAQIEASRGKMAASARLSALGMMAGGVAHEINNPLAIIHAAAADLLRRIKEEGSVPVAIVERNGERILDTTNRITRIIRSMRQLAREGSQDRVRPASVAKIVQETLEVCEERFKSHSINLLLPKIDPAVMVSCRDVQIGQVLFNLLQNAFDAIVDLPGERWIRLEVTLDAGSAVFSIIDSGPGVPAELKTKIMEPFFTTKEVGKGIGLGLSLSRTIVEEHGGKLKLTDEAGHPCFSFRIPLAHKAEPVCN